jgi:hypothetical protein
LISLVVAGTINPAYDYFVVFNTSNVSSPSGLTGGPCPVIATGSANGFVSGAATHFFEYNGSNPLGEIYSFVPNGSNPIAQFAPVGPPTSLSVTTNSIQFRVPLSYLATSQIPVTSIQFMQLNFMCYSALLESGASPVQFDALGNSSDPSDLNHYITISTSQGATYNNTYEDIEPSGDVQTTTGSNTGSYTQAPGQGQEPISSLDITGWSVQVEN